MNFLKEIFVKRMIRADVVHSLPGRLRLNLPFLKEIPKELSMEKNYLQTLKQIDGIIDYDFSYITGNVLLKYDVKKISEDTILNEVEIILRFVKENITSLTSQKVKDKEEVVELFKKHFIKYCNRDRK